MCSCGGLLTEEGIQHVPAPGVCERMGGGLLDSPRFVAVERGLAELREVLGQLRAVSTSADERCGILETAIFASDAVNRVVGTENRLAALAEQVGLIEHLQTHRDSKRIAFCERQVVDLNNRAEALQVRVDVLESFHDPDAGHLRDTPVSDAVTGLAERVAKLEQAEARREKLAEIRADRLARTGEGIYVPPSPAKPEPARPRDCPETTSVAYDADIPGPDCTETEHVGSCRKAKAEPARPSERVCDIYSAECDRRGVAQLTDPEWDEWYRLRKAQRIADEEKVPSEPAWPRDWDPITCQPIAGDFNGPHGPEPAACAVCGSTDPIQHFYHHKSEPTRPSEADVAYVRAEVDRDHYRDRVFRAEATLARLRAWVAERDAALGLANRIDQHATRETLHEVLRILDGADAKGGG
jgi:hypothetical protein